MKIIGISKWEKGASNPSTHNLLALAKLYVAETLAMVSQQNLDIRTITLGINLRGCVDADVDALARKVYDRMTTAAERLVPTAEQLEREFGIPIVNKRISVTPTTPGPDTPTFTTSSASPEPWKAPAMKGLSSTALQNTTSLPAPMHCWPRSWKPSAWASAAAPAPRRRWPC